MSKDPEIQLDAAEFARVIGNISTAVTEKADHSTRHVRVMGAGSGGQMIGEGRGATVVYQLDSLRGQVDAALHYDRLVQVAQTLRGEMRIRFKDGWAHIVAGKVRTRVASVEHLGLKPQPAGLMVKVADARQFRAAVKAAGVTVAQTDTGSHAFSTLHISQDGGRLTVESADGHGLIRTGQPCEAVSEGGRLEACLMGNQVATLVMASMQDGPLMLGVSGPRLHVETAGAILQLATGASAFPDTDPLIPSEAMLHTATLGRLALMEAVRRASHFGLDQPVEFEWAKGRVTVRSRQGLGVTGEYEEDVPQAGADKARCKWAVAPKRLLSALAELHDERVTVSFNGSQDRLLFTGTATEGLTFKYVTMPHR